MVCHSLLDVNCWGWSRGDSGEEHEHQSDAVLGSVMVFRLAAGAVAEVVVPLGLAKAGFLSGSTGVLGVVAAAEERSEDEWCPMYGSTTRVQYTV